LQPVVANRKAGRPPWSPDCSWAGLLDARGVDGSAWREALLE
jgi:hypothetical protein